MYDHWLNACCVSLQNLQWARDVLLGSSVSWQQLKHMPAQGLFCERNKTNLFNVSLTRAPLTQQSYLQSYQSRCSVTVQNEKLQVFTSKCFGRACARACEVDTSLWLMHNVAFPVKNALFQAPGWCDCLSARRFPTVLWLSVARSVREHNLTQFHFSFVFLPSYKGKW